MELHFKTTLLFVTLLLTVSCGSTKNTVIVRQPTNDVLKDTIIKTDEVIESITLETESIETSENNLPKSNIVELFNHDVFDQLLKNNISDKGETNYPAFIKNKTIFKSYLTALSENMPTEEWTKEDNLAYWMNAYNAFTIKLIIDNYPTKSIKDIRNAWDSRFFKLGEKWYNLSDIEHKILRKMNDPRIHFGINCASYSCPQLHNKAFTANNVNDELNYLTHQFINDPTRNTISKDSIQLSKIFQWYAKDFKTEGSLIDYLNKYSDITINNNAKKSFKKYDWSLNEAYKRH